MRIVYDDAKQSEMVKAVEEFMDSLDVKRFVSYEWGTDRVQTSELRESIDRFIRDRGFRIGANVKHAHGIGNNCQHPVYYTKNCTEDGVGEFQQCGSININRGLYGECYVSCVDYNDRRVGPCYEIHARFGVKKEGTE